jgi:hypothetical protein
MHNMLLLHGEAFFPGQRGVPVRGVHQARAGRIEALGRRRCLVLPRQSVP